MRAEGRLPIGAGLPAFIELVRGVRTAAGNCSNIQRITPWASRPPNGPPGRLQQPDTAPLPANITSGPACSELFREEQHVQVLPFGFAQGGRCAHDDTVRRSVKAVQDSSRRGRIRVKDGCPDAVRRHGWGAGRAAHHGAIRWMLEQYPHRSSAVQRMDSRSLTLAFGARAGLLRGSSPLPEYTRS